MDTCPQCQGSVWDNRETNVKRLAEGKSAMPIYSCKDKDGCGWKMWPPKPAKGSPPATPQQVSGYNGNPSFSKQSVPVNDKPDWDNIALGKVRHGFAIEAFKLGKKLDTKTVMEINEWTAFVMTGKLNQDLDI